MFEVKLYNNLNCDSSKIIQDEKIKIILKEHQKTAIKGMIEFEENGKVSFTKRAYIYNYQLYDDVYNNYEYSFNSKKYNKEKIKDMNFEIETNYGILADKVGSGKTYMTMGLICYKQIPNERDRIINSAVYTVTKYKDTEKSIKTNLIIVPHNLTHQWKLAFNNCILNTYVITKKSDVENLIFQDNIFENDKPLNDAEYNESNCVSFYDCIIISSTMFDNFYSKFYFIKWARIIIDEVVSIKLPPELEFKCNFIWFLTATPSGIKYVRRNYIRLLVNSITDNTLNYIIIKNDDDYVDNSMNLPNINQIIIKCLTPKEINLIRGYVDEEIINMINAGNIQEAATKLNCNIETSDNILEVLTKKIKKELHNKKQELEYENRRIPDDNKIHEEKIKKIKEKIKTLEIRYTSIEEKIKLLNKNECPICFDILKSPILTKCCNNLFCLECIIRCTNCPLCRTEIKIEKCTYINDNKTINSKSLCSKAENLITLIKKKPNGKFLVFSEFEKTFDNLNDILNENNISFNRLVGSGIVINSIIRRFQSGEINVLMLNANNYGSGLNLQMATDVIIYHELKLELETQVIGRAQRLGREDSLNVYYLFNDNEKVNCKNPTLNLDIFNNDSSMLDNFLNIESSDNIPKIENNSESDNEILYKKKKNRKPISR